MNIKRIIVANSIVLVSLILPLASFAGTGDWTGAYVGAHAGYGQDNDVALDFPGGGSSDSFDMTGSLGGIQGGYNWAAGGVVLGVEVNASAADVNGDAACATGSAQSCGAKMDQLYTLQGRIGMPLNNFLLYASLGGASGQVEAKRDAFSDSGYQTGWLAGIGGAMAFTTRWNGLVEFQYIDFGSNDYALGGSSVSVDNKFYVLKLGANYRF